MMEREHVGRDQRVGLCEPRLVIGRTVIRYDKVEIQHQPIELLLAQAAAVKKHRPARRAMLCRNRFRHRGDARVDRLAELVLDEHAEVVSHGDALSGDAHEG